MTNPPERKSRPEESERQSRLAKALLTIATETVECLCGQPLWAPVSVERGYCEACRLGTRTAVLESPPAVECNTCPGCDRMRFVNPCYPGCGVPRG